jgi:diaminopimelate decarboxylase
MFRSATERLRAFPKNLQFGLHYHLAASRVGLRDWTNELLSLMSLARAMSELAGLPVQTIDLGGGWPASALEGDLLKGVGAIARQLPETFPDLTQIIIEPGKILAEPSMALYCTVLDIRPYRAGRAAVVDASIAELPDWQTHVHPVLWSPQRHSGRWSLLGAGNDAVIGRLCMEHDEPSNAIALPDELRPGDILAFLDAGAYDSSMAFNFGM